MDGVKRSHICRIDRGGTIEHCVIHADKSYPCQHPLGLTPDGGRVLDPLQSAQNLYFRKRTRYHFRIVTES